MAEELRTMLLLVLASLAITVSLAYLVLQVHWRRQDRRRRQTGTVAPAQVRWALGLALSGDAGRAEFAADLLSCWLSEGRLSRVDTLLAAGALDVLRERQSTPRLGQAMLRLVPQGMNLRTLYETLAAAGPDPAPVRAVTAHGTDTFRVVGVGRREDEHVLLLAPIEQTS